MKWLKSLFTAAKPKSFSEIIDETVKNTVSEVIERELPILVPKAMKDCLEKTPDAQLNALGFSWAMAIALKEHWPDLDLKEASRLMWDYLDGIKFGDPGYSWSYSAAKELAHQYVLDSY